MKKLYLYMPIWSVVLQKLMAHVQLDSFVRVCSPVKAIASPHYNVITYLIGSNILIRAVELDDVGDDDDGDDEGDDDDGGALQFRSQL